MAESPRRPLVDGGAKPPGTWTVFPDSVRWPPTHGSRGL